MAIGKIYEIGPVFRAEPSHGSRQATEFISVDVELVGVRSETELIELECAMLMESFASTLSTLGQELVGFYPKATMPSPVKVLTFREAQALLGITGEESLSAEEERCLGAVMEEQGHELVALTQVPWKQRPFYHMREGPNSRAVSR